MMEQQINLTPINLTAELTRMYLMLRGVENALGVSKELDNLESNVQKKKKELAELDGKIKKTSNLLDTELDKIADEVEQFRKKAMEDIDTLRKEHALEKDGLVKKIAGLNEDAKKLDAKVKGKAERSVELDIEIAQKEKDLNNFNKKIEETKTEFLTMFNQGRG